jgi:glucokinase
MAHGDEQVEEMLRARIHVVGIALSSVVNFLNPDVVVLGGGLIASMEELVVEEFEAGMREYLSPEVGEAVKVRAAKLTGDSGALGAAYASWEALQEKGRS